MAKNIHKLILSIAFLLVAAIAGHAKDAEQKRIYIFGFAASFSDSVAYITPLQELDSAYIGEHNFLVDRPLYTLQFANYLEKLGRQNMTCCVFFEQKKAKASKTYAKILKKYAKGEKVQLAVLPENAFQFKPQDYTPEEQEKKAEQLKVEDKAKRKGLKGAPAGKPGEKPAGMPGGAPGRMPNN